MNGWALSFTCLSDFISIRPGTHLSHDATVHAQTTSRCNEINPYCGRPNISGFSNDTIVNYPLKNIFEDRTIFLNLSVREYQNDRVNHELIPPLTTNGAPMSYLNPYSATYPFVHNGPLPFSTDSSSGIIFYRPIKPSGPGAGIHSFMIGIKATEFGKILYPINFITGVALLTEGQRIQIPGMKAAIVLSVIRL